jgi:tetratricopeptide (TPR) repeat protein
MPAGAQDSSYPQRLDRLNLNQIYRDGIGEPLVRAFKKLVSESGLYNYVLIDSRTGMSEVSGICTRDLADHVVVLSGLNRQNIEGTGGFLRLFRQITHGTKTIQIILSPVPNGEDDLFEKRRAMAEERFSDAWGSPLELSAEIPYHPLLALTEEPHIFRRQRGHLFEAYRSIEQKVLAGVGHDADGFLKQTLRLMEQGQYLNARRHLDHLARLDGGQSALDHVRGELAQGSLGSVWPSPCGTVSLETILNHPDGIQLIEHLVESVQVSSEDYGFYHFVSQLLVEDLEKTLPIFGRYISRQNDIDWLLNLEKRLSDPVDEMALSRAVELVQDDLKQLQGCAWRCCLHGKLEDAEALVRRAVLIAPDDAPLLSFHGTLLEHLNRVDEAEVLHRKAVFHARDSVRPWVNLGEFLLGSGKLEEGQQVLLKAYGAMDFNDHPYLVRTILCLAWVSRTQGMKSSVWESFLKHMMEHSLSYLLEQGLPEWRWRKFTRVLAVASPCLQPEVFRYLKTITDVFVSDGQMSDLQSFPEWQALEAKDPTLEASRRPIASDPSSA